MLLTKKISKFFNINCQTGLHKTSCQLKLKYLNEDIVDLPKVKKKKNSYLIENK